MPGILIQPTIQLPPKMADLRVYFLISWDHTSFFYRKRYCIELSSTVACLSVYHLNDKCNRPQSTTVDPVYFTEFFSCVLVVLRYSRLFIFTVYEAQ